MALSLLLLASLFEGLRIVLSVGDLLVYSVVHLVRPVSAGVRVVWELESDWEEKEDSCHRREKEEEQQQACPSFMSFLACGSVEGRDGQVEESDTDTDS